VFDRALKTMRQYHRLNQAEMATKLCLSKSYVSEIERGRKEPSLDVLRKYSKAFEVPLSSLMLFAERSSGSGLERARVFAADKVLRMLEWIADGEGEAEDNGSEGAKRPHTA